VKMYRSRGQNPDNIKKYYGIEWGTLQGFIPGFWGRTSDPRPYDSRGVGTPNEERLLNDFIRRNRVLDEYHRNAMISSVTNTVRKFCTSEMDRKLVTHERVAYFRRCHADAHFWIQYRIARAVIMEGCRLLSLSEPQYNFCPTDEEELSRDRNRRIEILIAAVKNVCAAYPLTPGGGQPWALQPCWEVPHMKEKKPYPFYPELPPWVWGWELVHLDHHKATDIVGQMTDAREAEAGMKAGRENRDLIEQAEAYFRAKEFVVREEARERRETDWKEAREAREKEEGYQKAISHQQATYETAATFSPSLRVVPSQPRLAIHPDFSATPLLPGPREQKAPTIITREVREDDP